MSHSHWFVLPLNLWSLSPYANESLDWRWQIFQRLDRHLLLHLGCFDDHYLGQHLYVHFLFPAVLGQTGENRIEQKSIIQSCSASGKRRLEIEFVIYWLFVGKSHWTHHFVCVIGRHWCGAWVSKKSVNFVLPQSPNTRKNSPDFLWLWTDRIMDHSFDTILFEPSRLKKHVQFHQQPAILLLTYFCSTCTGPICVVSLF